MSTPEQSAFLPCIALGADAGGSKVRILVKDENGIREQESPSVNLRRVVPEDAGDQLANAILLALEGRSFSDNAVCCLGAAGAGTAAVALPLRDALSERLGLPAEQIIVTSDAHIAHRAAFGTSAGILIIAGTGSGCYGVSENGTLLRAGGWGPGLEDPGSGSELGREAVKRLLADLESGILTSFSRTLATSLGLSKPRVPDILDAFYHPEFKAARLAPVVLDAFESGDPQATSIVDRQVGALARQATRLATTMTPAPQGIALVGGLTQRASYVSRLQSALTAVLPDLPAACARRSPAEGALEWANTERKRLSP
jgi:glucosamine kinase